MQSLRYTIDVDVGLGLSRVSYRGALMRGTLSLRAYSTRFEFGRILSFSHRNFELILSDLHAR
jgi:hypothetical protein